MASTTTQILALLELLQRSSLASGSELARELGVDPRTLRRYVSKLQDLGIPVVTVRGRDGGYRLLPGYRLPPMMFTNEEAVSLVVGLRAARGFGIGNSRSATSSALAKLERAMPVTMRERVKAIGSTISVAAERLQNGVDAGVFSMLSVAADRQQRVRIAYTIRERIQGIRDVDPYGLAFLDQNWYVVGFCQLRQAMRSFRLDRIAFIELLPASFGRDSDFDALAFLKDSIRSLPRKHAADILLRANLAAASSAIFGALGELESVSGGTLLRCQVDDLAWLARELSRLPFEFDVLTPQELRAELTAHAKRLASYAAFVEES